MSKSFTGDIIDATDRLLEGLESLSIETAKDVLHSTVADTPRPPFDTGTLRRSGRAYVDGKFVSSTHRMREAQGRNPVTASRNRNKGSKKYLASGEFSVSASGGSFVPMQKGIIEIIYKTPYAAKMHNWHGQLTDSESGPGFISTKFMKLGGILQNHLNKAIRKW
jgi:hypothetical protein